MKKTLTFALCAAAACASNYRIMPLSPNGLALAGSNIAKSYGADAAIYNPANMAFLGDRPQVSTFASVYHVGGAKFTNQLDNSLDAVNANTPNSYANASDAEGEDYNFVLGSTAAILPINERHFLGLAVYTDMAAVFGWKTPYGKMLADNFDIRSGTAALSYAYKPFDDLSLAASLTVNHAKLRYSLIKDHAKNPRYFGNERVCLSDGTCTANEVIDHVFFGQHNDGSKDFTNTELKEHFVYRGKFSGKNDWPLGYKLAATYSPSALDNRLNLSLVYNSKYNSDFKGDISYEMARWGIYDFISDAIIEYPEAIQAFPLPEDADFVNEILYPVFGPKLVFGPDGLPMFGPNGYPVLTGDYDKFTDESATNRGRINGPAKVGFDYPASIHASASYSAGRHDFLFSYAHTFWSRVNNLRLSLGYAPELKNPLEDTSLLDVIMSYVVTASTKIKWHDTDFFSIGYRYNGDKWALMGGIATEDTPLPRGEMTFMSKDARMYQFSAGLEYYGLDKLTISLAFAHQQFSRVNTGYVNDVLVKSRGSFHGQSTQIATVGLNYIF